MTQHTLAVYDSDFISFASAALAEELYGDRPNGTESEPTKDD